MWRFFFRHNSKYQTHQKREMIWCTCSKISLQCMYILDKDDLNVKIIFQLYILQTFWGVGNLYIVYIGWMSYEYRCVVIYWSCFTAKGNRNCQIKSVIHVSLLLSFCSTFLHYDHKNTWKAKDFKNHVIHHITNLN